MSNILWHTSRFHELSLDQFHDILKLRIDVFVVEQNCPYDELDDRDRDAVHIWGSNEADEVIAYARMLPPTDEKPPAIGRVIVREDARGKGVGHELMHKCLDYLKVAHGSIRSRLSAQEHLQGFYRDHGYITTSGVYDLDGIPHINMELNPSEQG
jgi:ElaA protein